MARRLDWALMEPDTADDADLLRAHGAGDPHAFARLYDRYDRPCFLYIRRTLGAAHADAAEDLHQDAWIAISRNAASFDPAKASFRAWLFTVARNKVWDHFRRQKVAVLTGAQDDAAMMVPDPGPTPLEQVQTRELAERLVSAVEALPWSSAAFVMFADAKPLAGGDRAGHRRRRGDRQEPATLCPRQVETGAGRGRCRTHDLIITTLPIRSIRPTPRPRRR